MLPMPASGFAGDFDLSRLGWSSASFRARKLVFSLESELSIDVVPSPVRGSPPTGFGTDDEALPSDVVRVTLDAYGMGRASKTRLWLDPVTAQAIERTQLRSGSRRRHKRMRFTSRGVEVEARRPSAGDDLFSPETWSGLRQRFEPFPAWLDEGVAVSEPTALFYVLSAAALDEPGDRLQVALLSDDELILVDAVVSGREEIEVDYQESSAAGERAVRGRVWALCVELGGRRLDPSSTATGLEFMGMKGNIQIFLDPETRAPLEVSGRVPVAGRAHARIRRLTVRDGQPTASSSS